MDNPLKGQSAIQQLLHPLIGEVRLTRTAHSRHDRSIVPPLRQIPGTRQDVGRHPVDIELRHHGFQSVLHVLLPLGANYTKRDSAKSTIGRICGQLFLVLAEITSTPELEDVAVEAGRN